MTDPIEFSIKPTIPELVKSFVRAGFNLETDLNDRMHHIGQAAVGAMQEEAPKRTGEFAQNITYRLSREGQRQVTVKVGMPQPLGMWITEGTKPHRIESKRGGRLSFFWPKLGRQAYFSFVNHPGTNPNPFHSRAYMRIAPTLEPELQQIAKNFAVNVST